jgi:hypothetical protein
MSLKSVLISECTLSWQLYRSPVIFEEVFSMEIFGWLNDISADNMSYKMF